MEIKEIIGSTSTEENVQDFVKRTFALADLNGDEVLSFDEFKHLIQNHCIYKLLTQSMGR